MASDSGEAAVGGFAAATVVETPEIAACLAKAGDLWIFAYGSLMWNPGFPFSVAEPALLIGYHRRFCLYSHEYRGTPECPGLVLGLDRGGACRGVAFRVPRVDAEAALRYLWAREMPTRSYRLKELPVRLGGGTVPAITFVVDRCNEGYTGPLSVEETARLIHQGQGHRGACRHYLENTVRHLERLGVLDGPMHELEQKVKALGVPVSSSVG